MSNNDHYELEFETLAANLKNLGAFPKFVQLARCGEICFANTSDDAFTSALMDRKVFVGASKNRFHAMSISLTEYIERKVTRGNPAFPTENEGVAGRSHFPLKHPDVVLREAECSALSEATERYVWATWWDNPEISFEIFEVQTILLREKTYKSLVDYVSGLFPGGRFRIIKPHYRTSSGSVVLINLFFLPSGGGVITGGACGDATNEDSVIFRGMTELVRHANSLARSLKDPNLKPQHLYDERLLFFGTREGAKLTQTRLELKGTSILDLPKLQSNFLLHHQYESAVALFHKLYEGQPPFIGGDLKRLCL